jgi:hypothetical protein
MASSDMNEIAMIDQAEFSNVGSIHTSTSAWPENFFSTSPEAFDTNTAYIWIPLELPAIETRTPLFSLSYTIAALNPASCAFFTFSSNVHPPLIIKAKGDGGPSTALIVNGPQAFKGSAV